MASQSSYKAVSTTNLLVSLPAFHVCPSTLIFVAITKIRKGIIWTGFSLCIVAFGIRLYSRYACFHRLLVDDCLMILSLTALLVNNIEDQLNLKHIYNLENVSNGIVEPGPDFLADTQKGVRAFGIAMLFAYIGIWLIKLNFIFFFKGLGAQSKAYVCFWWFVLGVTIACGAVSLGIMQYDCLFGSIEDVIIICAAPSTMKRTYTFFKLSCILDVISDALSKAIRLLRRHKYFRCDETRLTSISYLLSSVYSLERSNQYAKEDHTLCHIFACGFHNRRHYCSGQHIRRRVQKHRLHEHERDEHYLDLVLVFYRVYHL